MRLGVVASLISLTFVAAAIVPRDGYVLHERREAQHQRWTKRDRLSEDHPLIITLSLTERNLHLGHDMLMEVSDPASPKYGQHYTADQIIDIFSPAAETFAAVHGWLVAAGVEPHRIFLSRDRSRILVNSSASEGEGLFQAEYHRYEHLITGRTTIASDQYHVPADIQAHIDFVIPGIALVGSGNKPRDSMMRHEVAEPRGFRAAGNSSPPIVGPILNNISSIIGAGLLTQCDQYITPPCIRAMYNITRLAENAKVAPNNKLGLFEYGDMYSPVNLGLFLTTFEVDLNIPVLTQPQFIGIDGAGLNNVLFESTESDLDTQIGVSIIYPQRVAIIQGDDNYYQKYSTVAGFLNNAFYAIDGNYANATDPDADQDPSYPDPASFLLGAYKQARQNGTVTPPTVISISYGEQEDDLPPRYQVRQCNEFLKLGLAGVTVVVASGDSGVAARSADNGGSANGCLGPNGTTFNPDYPASCPYLTAVGAVYLPTGANAARDEEVAVTSFPSGGGFSNIYTTPAYQQTAVTNYLSGFNSNYTPYNISYNGTGGYAYGTGQYNKIGRMKYALP